jgi:bis(5'-nucleosyl)-tetraphosphatase (symmetrical)
MAQYVIGDVQGCFKQLKQLTDKLNFNEDQDRLYFVGDLVNRGPASAQVLDFIMQRPDNCFSVLGNHDLHLLAVGMLGKKPHKYDTFQDILEHQNRNIYLDWIRQQPLAISLNHPNTFISHAGLYPDWSIEEALALADEVSQMLQSELADNFLKNMYGNTPDTWHNSLQQNERWRFIVNAYTRMRFITPDRRLELTCKQPIGKQPTSFQPWFDALPKQPTPIYFGHWAALEGFTGRDDIVATDTGCAWGGSLTAIDIESGQIYKIPFSK